MKFLDVCSQVSIVYTVYHASREEKVWHLGGNLLTASLEQSATAYMALKQLSHCFECVGTEFLSWKSWTPLALSPLLIGTFHSYLSESSSEWEEFIAALSFNMGHVGRVVVVTATFSLAILGDRARSAMALGVYSICLIGDHDQISPEIRKVILLGFHLLTISAGLYQSKNPIERISCGLDLLGLLDQSLEERLYGDFTEKNLQDVSKLTYDEFCAIDSSHLVINPNYLKRELAIYGNFPTTYDAFSKDLDLIIEKASLINWEMYIDKILAKLKDDEQWQLPKYVKKEVRECFQDYYEKKVKKEEVIGPAIAYLKEGLHILAYRLKQKEASLMGVSADSPQVALTVRSSYAKNMMGISNSCFEGMKRTVSAIAKLIEEAPSSETVHGSLIRLGIDGANYCGTRISDLFEIIAKDLFEEHESINNITGQILREKQISYIYNLMEKETEQYPQFYRRLIGEHTPHRRNLYLKFYGHPLSLNTTSTDYDETTPKYLEGSRLLWIWWVRNAKKEFFTDYYTPQNIIHWLKEQIEACPSRLNWEKVEAWFQEENVKSEMICDLNTGLLKEEALRFLALKLGALGLTPRDKRNSK